MTLLGADFMELVIQSLLTQDVSKLDPTYVIISSGSACEIDLCG